MPKRLGNICLPGCGSGYIGVATFNDAFLKLRQTAPKSRSCRFRIKPNADVVIGEGPAQITQRQIDEPANGEIISIDRVQLD
jgi:hypothetical protein